MATDEQRPAIHQGMTDLLELKSCMLHTVLRLLAILIGLPVALYLVIVAVRFAWYVAGRIMP